MPGTTLHPLSGRPQMGFHVLQAAADDFLACQVVNPRGNLQFWQVKNFQILNWVYIWLYHVNKG